MDAGASLAVELANTVHAVRGRLRDGLDAWLEPRGHLGERERFAELRDAVRDLIEAAATGGRYAPRALAVVNRASGAVPSWTELTDGPAVALRTDPAASAAEAEAAAIARDAITLLGSERRETLRACQAPGCVQFFVTSHKRQEFCGPVCGNRARAARHYARHKGE
jgi:predicted RNA-binding Zn ribbon-like protein